MDRKPGFAYHGVHDVNGDRSEELPRDANGFTIDGVCGADEYAMLSECGMFTDTGVWQGLFTYPSCGWILVERGWATAEKLITDAGRAALAAGRVDG